MPRCTECGEYITNPCTDGRCIKCHNAAVAPQSITGNPFAGFRAYQFLARSETAQQQREQEPITAEKPAQMELNPLQNPFSGFRASQFIERPVIPQQQSTQEPVTVTQPTKQEIESAIDPFSGFRSSKFLGDLSAYHLQEESTTDADHSAQVTAKRIPRRHLGPFVGKCLDMHDFLYNTEDDEYIAFDLETSGLSPDTAEIVEIGAVRTRRGQILDSFSQLVKPSYPIPPEATAVNNITNEMVDNMPTIREVLPQFVAFVGNHPLAAHNADFDIRFLSQAFHDTAIAPPEIRYVDTLRMAHHAWFSMPNYKLETLASELGIAVNQAHRALDDAEAVAHLVEAIRAELEEETKRCTLRPRLIKWLAANMPCIQRNIASSFPGEEKGSIRSIISSLEGEGSIERIKDGASYRILPAAKPRIMQAIRDRTCVKEAELACMFEEYTADIVLRRVKELEEDNSVDRLIDHGNYVIAMPLQDRLIAHIKQNPGCLQNSLSEAFPYDNPDAIKRRLKQMSDCSLVTRCKVGRTYTLTYNEMQMDPAE